MNILTKGDSMLPTLIDNHRYYVERISDNNICVGDIIVYYIEDIVICHRVIDILRSKSDKIFIKTKGDNCAEADPYAITLDRVIGKIII